MIAGRSRIAPHAVKVAKELEAVQSLMPMSKDDKAKLRASIEKHGVKDPLRGYYKGTQFYLLSGYNRLEIARDLGFELLPCEELDIKPKDRVAYAIDENLARRQLNTEQKRALVDYLLNQNPQASSRLIAKKIGASHNTVEARRSQAGGQIDHLKRQGKDGKTYPLPQREQGKNREPERLAASLYIAKAKQKERLKAEFRQALLACGQGLKKSEIQTVLGHALKEIGIR